MSIIITIMIGFIVGLIARAGWIASVVGAIIVLFVYGLIDKRS